MSKYKTMEDWYKEALDEGRLWKDTKISTAEYKRRVQQLLRNPEALARSQEVKKRYELFNVKDDTLKSWSAERQKYYWMREYYIATGEYDRLRFRQWKKNYIDAMKKTGISQETIKEFERSMTYNTKDLIDLLPTLKIFYFQPLKEGKYENEQERQILQGLDKRITARKKYRRVYMKRYRALNRERNRAYMRAYMKAYRARKKNR